MSRSSLVELIILVLIIGMLPKKCSYASEHCSFTAMTTGGEGGPLDLFSMIKGLVQERSLVFTF